MTRRGFSRWSANWHDRYVPVCRSGDSHLPLCPDCREAGRRRADGEPIHLVTDGTLLWCEACSHEVPYDIDPDGELAQELLKRWDDKL